MPKSLLKAIYKKINIYLYIASLLRPVWWLPRDGGGNQPQRSQHPGREHRGQRRNQAGLQGFQVLLI